MTVRTLLIQQRDDWNHTLASLPNPHVLQTWEWGEIKQQTGWHATRVRVLEEDHLIGQALILRRPLPLLPWALGYVPKGPILNWSDPRAVEMMLDVLETTAREQGLLFLKIDPDVDPDTPTGEHVIHRLTSRGWRISPQPIQFRNTVLLDITGTEEELLARMKSKWRYNIRLAQRRGVTVREGTISDLPQFYALYEETARRDAFLIRPYTYYEQVWRTFMERKMAVLLMAEWEGRAVAGVMLFLFGPRAWYMYGASASGEVRKHMPNHLLQWEAIRVARSRGCTVYDMWGAPDVLNERDPMWGVYRFKMGFGGRFQRWIGAWDFPVRSRVYDAYVRTLPQFMHTLSRVLTHLRGRIPAHN